MFRRSFIDRFSFRHLRDSEVGTTVAEYSIMLGVLVGGGILAYLVTGASASQVYQITAHVLTAEKGSVAGASDVAGPSNETIEYRGIAALLAETGSNMQAAVASAAVLFLGLLVWAATILLGMRLWHAIQRRLTEANQKKVNSTPSGTRMSPGAFKRLVEKRQQIRRLLAHDLDRSPGCETQVRHLMSRTLTTVPPEMNAADAFAIMRDQHIRHLLVCRPGNDLIGIISDRDVDKGNGRTASDIMSASPAVVAPEMEIGPAITLMLNRGISCLPVCRQGRVIGVLTTTDLLLSFQCLLQVLETRTCSDGPALPEVETSYQSLEREEEDLSMLIEQ
jgi:acetoin utilization protein AcuB